jgi:hypothetical protein
LPGQGTSLIAGILFAIGNKHPDCKAGMLLPTRGPLLFLPKSPQNMPHIADHFFVEVFGGALSGSAAIYGVKE